MPHGLWNWPCLYTLPLHQAHWQLFGNHIHPLGPDSSALLEALWVFTPAGASLPWAFGRLSFWHLLFWNSKAGFSFCRWLEVPHLVHLGISCLQLNAKHTAWGQWILIERMNPQCYHKFLLLQVSWDTDEPTAHKDLWPFIYIMNMPLFEKIDRGLNVKPHGIGKEAPCSKHQHLPFLPPPYLSSAAATTESLLNTRNFSNRAKPFCIVKERGSLKPKCPM